jgi:hypothetical protein
MTLSKSEQARVARVNGAKLRCPKTTAAKARSPLLALKHGRFATKAIILKNEDSAALENLLADYVRRIQPVSRSTATGRANPRAFSRAALRLATGSSASSSPSIPVCNHERRQSSSIQSPAVASASLAIFELTRLLTASLAIVGLSKLPGYLTRSKARRICTHRPILVVLENRQKLRFRPIPSPKSFHLNGLGPNHPFQTNPERTQPKVERPPLVPLFGTNSFRLIPLHLTTCIRSLRLALR